MLDGLLLFRTDSGQYAHLLDNDDNWYATGQVALARLEVGCRRLYDLRPEGSEGDAYSGGAGTVTQLYPDLQTETSAVWVYCVDGVLVAIVMASVGITMSRRKKHHAI